jgi:hypothetical protein
MKIYRRRAQYGREILCIEYETDVKRENSDLTTQIGISIYFKFCNSFRLFILFIIKAQKTKNRVLYTTTTNKSQRGYL